METIGRPFSESSRASRPMLAAVGFLAALDFLAPGMLVEFEDAIAPQMVLLGALVGQLLLLSVWAVLGPAQFWRRWLAALAVACCLYATFLAGMAVTEINASDQQLFSVNLLLLPVMFLAAQTPLWLLRLVLGRGLALEERTPRDRDGGAQFRMRDLLTIFALLGVSLGLARLGISLHYAGAPQNAGEAPWLSLAVACAALAIWSLLATLPCVWGAFLARDSVAASGVVAGYALTAVFAATAALAVLVGVAYFAEILVVLLAFHVGLLTILLGGCHAARGWGCTLRRKG